MSERLQRFLVLSGHAFLAPIQGGKGYIRNRLYIWREDNIKDGVVSLGFVGSPLPIADMRCWLWQVLRLCKGQGYGLPCSWELEQATKEQRGEAVLIASEICGTGYWMQWLRAGQILALMTRLRSVCIFQQLLPLRLPRSCAAWVKRFCANPSWMSFCHPRRIHVFFSCLFDLGLIFSNWTYWTNHPFDVSLKMFHLCHFVHLVPYVYISFRQGLLFLDVRLSGCLGKWLVDESLRGEEGSNLLLVGDRWWLLADCLMWNLQADWHWIFFDNLDVVWGLCFDVFWADQKTGNHQTHLFIVDRLVFWKIASSLHQTGVGKNPYSYQSSYMASQQAYKEWNRKWDIVTSQIYCRDCGICTEMSMDCMVGSMPQYGLICLIWRLCEFFVLTQSPVVTLPGCVTDVVCFAPMESYRIPVCWYLSRSCKPKLGTWCWDAKQNAQLQYSVLEFTFCETFWQLLSTC